MASSRVLGALFCALIALHAGVVQADGIKMLFAVKSRNLDYLTDLLLDVSDPDSRNYGNHLSVDEISSLFVDSEARSGLLTYLRTHLNEEDIHVSLGGDFITAEIPLYHMMNLFPETTYRIHESQYSGYVFVDNLVLPEIVEQFVDFVSVASEKNAEDVAPYSFKNSKIQDSDDGLVTPDLLRKFYNIDATEVDSIKATQCVFESLNQSYSQKDLDLYLARYNLQPQIIKDVIGPNVPSDCYIDGGENCGEANLDVQVILGIAQGSPTTYWSVSSGISEFEPFLEWILAVADDANPPLVHSVSYGDVESDLDNEMMKRFNVEVQKLGLRGVTVIVSSGDDGVGNYVVRQSVDNCAYNPSFPASSPYVTTIGATQGPEVGDDEAACSSKTGGLITTGGGFSNVFEMPEWQRSAVETFLNNTDAQKGYNAHGRGYPDVSMLGHDYAIYLGGAFRSVSGTSASAPAFASLVTLVNSQRLANGKSSLGYLNPAIYKYAQIFNDVTAGENHCAAAHTNPNCCSEGFDAITGWDPTTGLGTVDFARFNAAFSLL